MLNQTRLWTAVITPLNQQGQVDLKSFENLLREQEEAKNGVVILGSTGEALNLGLEEKKEIVNFADKLRLSTPVMIGVGGHHLESTLEWVNFLESKKNLNAYLLVTPLYAKPGTEGQYHWFKALLDQSTRPCMLYNVPGRTGVSMSPQACHRLANHPNFWSIKEASGSVEKFKEYREITKATGQLLFSGDDAMTPEFAPHGCFGLVSVASNVWPNATHLYVNLATSGKLTKEEKVLWEQATQALFSASNPIPTKAILFSQGRIQSALLRAPLHIEDLREMGVLHQADQKISNWFEKKSRRTEKQEQVINEQLA